VLFAVFLSNIYLGLFEGIATASGMPLSSYPSSGVWRLSTGASSSYRTRPGDHCGHLPGVAAAAADHPVAVQLALPGFGGVEAVNRILNCIFCNYLLFIFLEHTV
jgi:hypothetical protein